VGRGFSECVRKGNLENFGALVAGSCHHPAEFFDPESQKMKSIKARSQLGLPLLKKQEKVIKEGTNLLEIFKEEKKNWNQVTGLTVDGGGNLFTFTKKIEGKSRENGT